MPKVTTENVVCIACGADVRSEALFCYNCGGAVATPSNTNGEPKVEQEILEISTKDTEIPVESKESELPAEELVRPQPRKTSDPLTPDRLRRKRASNRQPVEVIWEVPSSSSNLFVIASVGLTIAAAVVLALALYLK